MRSSARYQSSPSHATSTSTSDYVSSKNLPHLPRGVRVPKLHATSQSKPLPRGEWQEEDEMQVMIPGQQQGGGGGPRHELQPFHAGVSRMSQKTQDQEPPPIFASQPKRGLTLKRPTKVQQQIYRMSGGIEPVDLLCDRLNVWRLALKDMNHMFKNMVDVESKAANGYATSNKPLAIPFRESNNQFLHSGGVQDVWIAYRNYTLEKSMMHHEYVGYLKSAVVPSLSNLQNDVQNFIKSIERDPCLRSSILYNARQEADYMVNHLDTAIKYIYHSPDRITASEDPTLLNLGVIQSFKSLYNQENNLHENVIQLQREAATVEQRIFGSLHIITKNWEDFCIEHRMDAKTIVSKVTATFGNILPNSDWNEFVRRHQFQLVNEKALYKTDNDLTYANQSNNLCIPTKVNFLNRKSSFKKWKEGLYVLTPCGYLHGFKNARHFETDPLSPELSLFLPNATVSATDEQAEDLSFQIAMGRKKRMSFGGQKVYTFQANDESDLADWYSEAQRLSQVNDEHEVMDMEGVPPALPGMEPQEREQEYADNEQLALAALASGSNRLIDQGAGEEDQGEGAQQQERTMMESSDDDDHYDSNAKPTTPASGNNLSTAAVLPESPRLQRYQPPSSSSPSQRQKSKSPLSSRPAVGSSSAGATGRHTPAAEKDDAATTDASTKDLYSTSNGDDDDFVQKYNDKLIVDDGDAGSGKNKSTPFTSGNDGFVPRTSRIKEVL